MLKFIAEHPPALRAGMKFQAAAYWDQLNLFIIKILYEGLFLFMYNLTITANTNCGGEVKLWIICIRKEGQGY